MGSCIRRRSSAFTSFNFVCNLLRIVCRSTVYIPLLLFFTQICVKPRKLNVSGFPSPRRCRLLIANGPNSSSRVFSGCNSRWNFLILSVSSALRRSFLHPYSFPILQHAGVQPFLDQPHDAPIGHPMLDELDQPFVGKPIEKTFNVKIEHPVHFSRQQSRVQRIQRLMLASPGSEPVRKTEKIR